MKRLLALLLALCMCFALVACGGTDNNTAGNTNTNTNSSSGSNTNNDSSSGDSAGPKVLNVGLAGTPDAVIPNKVGQYNSFPFNQVYECLFNQVDGELVGVLAESWERVDDYTYRVHLYEGITDSLGNPFTASDVAFSVKIAKEGAIKYANNYEADCVTVEDDLTFTMKINSSAEGIFECCVNAIFMVTEAAYNASGDGMATKPIGTGPYVVESYNAGADCKLVKRDDYWQDPAKQPACSAANFDEINIYFITEATQMAIALEDGTIDLAGFCDFSISGDIEMMDGIVANHFENYTYNNLIFNTSDDRVVGGDNVKLRQALAYAIDKQAMVDGVYSGYGATAKLEAIDAAVGYNANWPATVPGYDADMAKKLLNEAGYNGETITILFQNKGEDTAQAELIQAFLMSVGVNVELRYSSSINTDRADGNWDITFGGGYGVFNMAQMFATVYEKNSATGKSTYLHDDPELYKLYDALMAPGGCTQANYDALYKYQDANCLVYPLFHKEVLVAHKDTITDWCMNTAYLCPIYLGTVVME